MALDPTLSWTRREVGTLDLAGLRAAVVGGTGGLGRAIANTLAGRGAAVTVVGQTQRDPGLAFLQADLSSMQEARRVAAALGGETLDLLVLTTGIFAAPTREVTAEGLERDLAVSYLSRLVILRTLAPRLGVERPAGRPRPRVFVMGYPGTGEVGTLDDLNAERSYAPMKAHMNTVAGNEALVLDGARRYPNLNIFGLNPGLVKTNIRDNYLGKDSIRSRVAETVIGWFTPTPEQVGAVLVPLLVSPDLEARSGAMFDQQARAILPSPKLTADYVDRFVAASEALVAPIG